MRVLSIFCVMDVLLKLLGLACNAENAELIIVNLVIQSTYILLILLKILFVRKNLVSETKRLKQAEKPEFFENMIKLILNVLAAKKDLISQDPLFANFVKNAIA